MKIIALRNRILPCHGSYSYTGFEALSCKPYRTSPCVFTIKYSCGSQKKACMLQVLGKTQNVEGLNARMESERYF